MMTRQNLYDPNLHQIVSCPLRQTLF